MAEWTRAVSSGVAAACASCMSDGKLSSFARSAAVSRSIARCGATTMARGLGRAAPTVASTNSAAVIALPTITYLRILPPGDERVCWRPKQYQGHVPNVYAAEMCAESATTDSGIPPPDEV